MLCDERGETSRKETDVELLLLKLLGGMPCDERGNGSGAEWSAKC